MANQNPQDILNLAQSIRQTYAEADRLSQSLGLESRTIQEALSSMNKLAGANASASEQFNYLNKTLGINQQQFDGLIAAQKRFQTVTNEVASTSKNSFQQIGEGVGRISAAYFGATLAVEQLASRGREAYQLLIGQNVELQEQLLATQSSLAATNDVLVSGQEISDPTKAIQALTEPVNQAIAKMRQGSLDLVGVTSSQLVPVYQIIAQNASSIGASLDESADLTLSFAAALGTLGVPLEQARQEVSSILQGQITSDSQVAKSLNLSNQQVAQWKAQGTLVAELNKRLEAFRAGNALAAQTINGVTSNISELIQEFGRLAGEPLLAPLVAQLDNVYQFLKANQQEIQSLVNGVVRFFLEIGGKLGEIFIAVQPALEKLALAIGNNLNSYLEVAGNTTKLLVDSFVSLVQVASPVLELIAGIALELSKINQDPFAKIILQSGLFLVGLNLLKPALVGVVLEGINMASRLVLLSEGLLAARASTLAFIAASGGASGILSCYAAKFNILQPRVLVVRLLGKKSKCVTAYPQSPQLVYLPIFPKWLLLSLH